MLTIGCIFHLCSLNYLLPLHLFGFIYNHSKLFQVLPPPLLTLTDTSLPLIDCCLYLLWILPDDCY